MEKNNEYLFYSEKKAPRCMTYGGGVAVRIIPRCPVRLVSNLAYQARLETSQAFESDAGEDGDVLRAHHALC